MAARSFPRRRDWERALVEWAEGLRGLPYEWGRTDCASLASDALGVLSDVAPDGPAYVSALGGVKALRKAQETYGGVGGWLETHGLERVEGGVLRAHSGDVLVREGDPNDVPLIAVVVGHWLLTADDLQGVVLERLETAVREALSKPSDLVVYRLPG